MLQCQYVIVALIIEFYVTLFDVGKGAVITHFIPDLLVIGVITIRLAEIRGGISMMRDSIRDRKLSLFKQGLWEFIVSLAFVSIYVNAILVHRGY